MLKTVSLRCHCVKEDNDPISGNGAFSDKTDAWVRLNGNWGKHKENVFGCGFQQFAYDNFMQVILLLYETDRMLATIKNAQLH